MSEIKTAEDKALELYPESRNMIDDIIHSQCRNAFLEGYNFTNQFKHSVGDDEYINDMLENILLKRENDCEFQMGMAIFEIKELFLKTKGK